MKSLALRKFSLSRDEVLACTYPDIYCCVDWDVSCVVVDGTCPIYQDSPCGVSDGNCSGPDFGCLYVDTCGPNGDTKGCIGKDYNFHMS